MVIAKRRFGRTEHMSSAVIFGGAALKACDQATADRVLDILLQYGVNHLDVAPRYGDAELRVGHWMDRHRDEFFLATKTDRFSRAGAREQLERSLERLRTDHVDLIQLHNLTHPDAWDEAVGPDGALEALLAAREEGLVRFIGVTGHGWHVAARHRRSLERYAFDSVLMPWNWFCAHHETYGQDFRATLELCRRRDVAVQTIKAIARGAWAAGQDKTRTTWYEPLEDQDDIRTAVAWVLSTPDVFLNSVGDIDLLPLVLKAAEEFTADEAPAVPSDGVMESFARRTGLSPIFGLS